MIVIIIYYICDIQYLLIFKAYEKFNFLPHCCPEKIL